MEKMNDASLDGLIALYSATLDNLRALRELEESGNCNDCANKGSCRICPSTGMLARYNCPDFIAGYHYHGRVVSVGDYPKLGIKGMMMPKNCRECPLFITEPSMMCNAMRPDVDTDTGHFRPYHLLHERPEWCPLIEIKE